MSHDSRAHTHKRTPELKIVFIVSSQKIHYNTVTHHDKEVSSDKTLGSKLESFKSSVVFTLQKCIQYWIIVGFLFALIVCCISWDRTRTVTHPDDCWIVQHIPIGFVDLFCRFKFYFVMTIANFCSLDC